MSRDARHDVLFEPIALGPKTLKNRFWQVPHCNGAGSDRPGMQAAFRGMKAQGGWGAVFTEVCFFTHDSDITPWVGSRLIDSGDIRNLALMCDSVHEHGALAGVELTHGSSFCLNAESRMPGPCSVADSERVRGPRQRPQHDEEGDPRHAARPRRRRAEGARGRVRPADRLLRTRPPCPTTSSIRSTTSAPTSTADRSRTDAASRWS